MTRLTGFLGRRNLIKAIGCAGIGYATTVACGKRVEKAATSTTPEANTMAATNSDSKNAATRPDTSNMTPDQALELLLEGNKRFVSGQTIHPRQDKARLMQTGADQFPFAAFLSCADSRVPIEEVFDQGIGDCFVTRVAGNVATPEVVGSLEFGTLMLGAKLIMVLGHERCGAVVAAMGRLDPPLPTDPGKIPTLVPYLTAGIKKTQEKLNKSGNALPADSDGMTSDLELTTKQNVLEQIAVLKQSKILSKLLKEGQLKIVGGYYDLDKGSVTLINS
jgi:Carbonic anhydrase